MASLAQKLSQKIKDIRKIYGEKNVIYQNLKQLAKFISVGTGAIFTSALIYFMQLGSAAAEGFVIGATTGGVVGAAAGGYFGFGIGVALAPYTFGISIPVFTAAGIATGGFVGATVFGVAGGLIGLGIASGSATAVTMGIGAGAGGAIGAYAGYGAGVAAWGGIVAVCATVTGGTCGALLVLEPAAGAIGGVVGAYVGGAIGASVGYVVGHYLLDPVKYYIKGVPNGVGSAASGTIAGLGHALTSLGSAIWGGFISGAGTLLSGAISLGGSIWGAITGIGSTVAGQIAAVSVGVGVASAAGIAIVSSGIITPGSFFTPLTDQKDNIYLPKESEYVTVTKTADPSTLQNSDLPKTINFKVTLQTKTAKLVNVTCDDQTILTKSDGSTKTLSINPAPVCPDTIDASTNLAFNFSTYAENTPDFQNANIVNTFNIHYDTESLATGSCGAGSNFANLLPNPIPASAGAVSPSILSRLNAPSKVVPAALYGAQKSGTACELLVGLHYVEGSWYDDGSFISGRKIGNPEPDVPNPGSCTAYNGNWTSSGCVFSNLNDTAYYAGDHIKDKMSALGYGWRPPASFQEMVGAMAYYNGYPGNSNCAHSTPYTGCPALYPGEDNSYVMTHFDTKHQTMYLVYCNDGSLCSSPNPFDRDGAATAAKEYYRAGAGPYP